MKLWTVKHEASHPGPHMGRVEPEDVTDDLVDEVLGKLSGQAYAVDDRGRVRQVLEVLFTNDERAR